MGEPFKRKLGAAVAWTLGALFLMLPGSAMPTQFETILMPGKLAEAHRSIEPECDLCHERFRKKGQADKCLACHDHADVASDIKEKKGLHGRLQRQGKVLCETCHTEHKGRDTDISGLSPQGFDHSQTDFVLRDSHLGTECRLCHESGKKRRAAPSDCYSCHKTQDVHKGKLGEKCADCHTEKKWSTTKFDHDKTEFPLKGRHQETACLLCHEGNRYKDTPKQCIDCHRFNDVHKGAYKEKCETCHVPDKWQQIDFDHNKNTKFPLRGNHRETQCSSCHKKELYKEKPKKECVACHLNDDWHKGRNGKKCESCHNEKNWRESQFDHNKKTKFKLDGKHEKLLCIACHKGSPEKEKDKRECQQCHLVNDVHKGGAGKDCADCHVTRDWKETGFKHERDTRFTLRGSHEKLVCNQCHRIAPKEQRLVTTCYDCHRRDDVHKGQQGRQCENCHNEETWIGKVAFEHDLSAFPLIGQHALVSCEACHVTSTFKDAPSACVECHRDGDVHKGRLGADCNSCHNPNAWTAWIFDHEKQTKFALRGAHETLACTQCHTSAAEKIQQSSNCLSCHRNDDVHLGSFGARCDRCHGLDSFQQLNLKH